MGMPLFLLMRWFYLRSQVVYRESRVISAQVIVKFVETMAGIRAVKAFRKEPRNDEEFGKLASDYRDINMRSIRLFGTFEPALMAVASVTLAVVVTWGGLRVLAVTLARSEARRVGKTCVSTRSSGRVRLRQKKKINK